MCEQILPPKTLSIIAAVEEMGREMMKVADDESATSPLEFYGEQYMEDLSEATYSEARREGRLSCRAFGSLIRVDEAELKKFKNAIGYRRNAYHDFAVCDTIIKALGGNKEYAPALPLLIPAADVKPQGPFRPDRKELDVLLALANVPVSMVGTESPTPEQILKHYVRQKIEVHKTNGQPISDVDAAAIKLASVFRLDFNGSNTVIDLIARSGASSEDIEVIFAHVVLDCIRSTPRFLPAVRWLDRADRLTTV